ncbi:MerR family transcriptional regulator [Limosilactobacillus sp.]|uniref:MerR family transcriptional regulator n=1 Tax=Limosilactobacillus sp. TaxID=2773925 RepID=UPI00359F2DC9
MDSLAQRLRNLCVSGQLKISLTELAKETGVSPRQVRYWERKGYIKSEQNQQNANHRFSLVTIFQVAIIKYFLDQGYTLTAAVQKERQRRENMAVFKQFIGDRITNVRQLGEHSGEVELGPLTDDPTKEVYALVKNGQTSLHLRPRQ